MTLRPYQARDAARIRQAWRDGARRVLYVLPTGGGKTVTFTTLAQEQTGQTLIAAHRRELIRQASAKLTVPHGIIMPGEPFRPEFPIQVGSIQTVIRRLDRLPKFDLIIPDEAHHAVSKEWRALFESQPQARVLGVTATPERLDGTGLAEAFDVMIEGPSIAELTADGYLVPARVFVPPGAQDSAGLKSRMGDFAAEDVADRMDKPSITGDVVGHYGKHAPGVPAVAFCATVAHARHVAEAFTKEGWNAACVYGDMPDAERDAALKGLVDGTVTVLTSCDLIGEGLDIPNIGAVIMLRHTQSLVLCRQQMGRGLRPAPGKTHLVCLDHVGNALRHGLPQAPCVWSLAGVEKKARTAPIVRQCPECYAAHPPAPVCPCCGHSYRTAGEGLPKQIEFREGELVEVIPPTLKESLAGCTSWTDVEAVRVERGYKPGWTHFIMDRYAIVRRKAALPESSDPTADFPVESVIISRTQAHADGKNTWCTCEFWCDRGGHYAPQKQAGRRNIKCSICANAEALATRNKKKAEDPDGFAACERERLKKHKLAHPTEVRQRSLASANRRKTRDPIGYATYREANLAGARERRRKRKAEKLAQQIMQEDRTILAALANV